MLRRENPSWQPWKTTQFLTRKKTLLSLVTIRRTILCHKDMTFLYPAAFLISNKDLAFLYHISKSIWAFLHHISKSILALSRELLKLISNHFFLIHLFIWRILCLEMSITWTSEAYITSFFLINLFIWRILCLEMHYLV